MKLQRSSPLRPYWLALLVLVLVLPSLACGPLNSVVDRATGGGGPMQAASDLWSDVPKMDGLTASQMDMPLFAKVIFNTIVGNLGLLNPQGEDRTTGKVDWIAFDTGKTPDEVQAFYTPQRMTANGWDTNDQSVCLQGSNFGVTEAGSVCLFTKQQDGVQTQLVIITAKAEQANTQHVFFIRLESTPTPVPPAGAGAVQPQATVTPMEVKPGMDVSTLKVCELLPAAAVERVLGRSLVSAPQPFNYNGAGTDVACSYDAGKDAANNAYFAYAVVAPTSDYASHRPAQPQMVTGLGDEAFFVNGADARQLWVLLNGKAAVMVAIGDAPNEAGSKTIAQLVVDAVQPVELR